MQDQAQQQPWWRRLRVRVSLRVFLVLILALGAGLGYMVLCGREQRDAVAAIRRAGGMAVYSWEWRDNDWVLPGFPERVFGRLCPDYFYTVKRVLLLPDCNADDGLMAQVGRLSDLDCLDLNECKSVTDGGLSHLRALSRLRFLSIENTGATGASLKYLEGMTRLKELGLPGLLSDADLGHLKGLTALELLGASTISPDITDAGLAQLSGLVNLKSLSIHSPRITSAGLASLRDMARLEWLDLSHCGVTDLAPIRHLKGLTSLDLTGTPMSDSGLAPVAELTRLNVLVLNDTPIGDAGLAHLRGLNAVASIELNRTRITDAGLRHLGGLNKLHLVFVKGTRITDEGIAKAKKQLPFADFVRTGP